MTDEKYPECEKLSKVSEVSNKIGEFIDWLSSKEYSICEHVKEHYDRDLEDYVDEGHYPININTEKLLAEFFDIDLDKVEEERRALLKTLQT